MKKIHNILSKVGLTEKQSVVFIALLEVGRTKLSILSRKANLPKHVVRYTINQLEELGLVTSVKFENSYHYLAESPDKLLFLLDQKKSELDETKTEVNNILGDLKNIANPQSLLPQVKFYSGKSSIIKLYKEILSQKSPIDSFEDNGGMEECISDYVKDYVKTRINFEIPARTICPKNNVFNRPSSKKLLKVKKINEKDFPFLGDIKINDHQVSFFYFDKLNPVAISIAHEKIVKDFKLLFNYFWNLL